MDQKAMLDFPAQNQNVIHSTLWWKQKSKLLMAVHTTNVLSMTVLLMTAASQAVHLAMS